VLAPTAVGGYDFLKPPCLAIREKGLAHTAKRPMINLHNATNHECLFLLFALDSFVAATMMD